MAKKRRRKKARRKSSSPRKRRALKRRKHRRASAAPRRRRSFRRKSKRNPRKRHRVRGHFAKRRGRGRRVRVRAHMSNPGRKKHRRKAFGRRRRRNPGGFFGDLALSVLAAVGGFVGTFAIGFLITPADQMVAKGQLYRGGVGLAGAAGGAYIAKKHPMIGIALAAGSLLGAFGGFLTLQVLKVLPQKSAPAQPTTKGLGAVFTNPSMSGYQQQLGAVFTNPSMSGYQQQLGAVFTNPSMSGYQQQLGALGMGDMGDPTEGGYAPPAPWMTQTPYDAASGY